MKNTDIGTVIRSVLLFIALINQTLIMFGKGALPISEDQVNTLADALYKVGSTVFTIITSIVAWFKNNYVTNKGKRQKEVLKQNGLIK
ncbi:phage holin [Bacillus changyiensis]|uniref:phage holin n=1 Tax=Bacillus changyiensis TaxID=3004103 RepID=UPI0022E7190D|nr:phage holin [Bacillus changyiensis]MDA1476150.1 phage holin [Bacillus changyiensis]